MYEYPGEAQDVNILLCAWTLHVYILCASETSCPSLSIRKVKVRAAYGNSQEAVSIPQAPYATPPPFPKCPDVLRRAQAEERRKKRPKWRWGFVLVREFARDRVNESTSRAHVCRIEHPHVCRIGHPQCKLGFTTSTDRTPNTATGGAFGDKNVEHVLIESF